MIRAIIKVTFLVLMVVNVEKMVVVAVPLVIVGVGCGVVVMLVMVELSLPLLLVRVVLMHGGRITFSTWGLAQLSAFLLSNIIIS